MSPIYVQGVDGPIYIQGVEQGGGILTLEQIISDVVDEVSGTAFASVGSDEDKSIAGGGDLTIVTASITVANAVNYVVVMGTTHALGCTTASSQKVRLMVAGVQQAESGYLSNSLRTPISVTYSEADMAVGATALLLVVHNYNGGATNLRGFTTAVGGGNRAFYAGSIFATEITL